MRLTLLISLLFTAVYTMAEESPEETLIYSNTVDNETVQEDSIQHKKTSPIKSWWNSLINGNIDRTFEKKADMTFAFSPYYSKESGIGIGGQFSSLYRTDRTDSLLHVSDISFMGGISSSGTYSIGLKGDHHFNRKKRFSYVMEFKHQNRDFWGINFYDCYKNPACNNEINRVNVRFEYEQRIISQWYWGAALRLQYAAANPSNNNYLDEHRDDKYIEHRNQGFYSGLGLLICYDSRDYRLNPKRGLYFMLREVYYPGILGINEKDVYCTTYQFNAYHKVWRNAILAYDVFAEFNSSRGVVPWQLREEICSDDRRMRGYYSGRYIDDNQMCAQAELRQRIYKRWGAVAWVGAGTLFYNFEEINGKQILPNYGVGLRFEMKANTNLRVDFGFGRNTGGLSFSFAEAF